MVTGVAMVPLWKLVLATPSPSVSTVSTVAVPPKVPAVDGERAKATWIPAGSASPAASRIVAVIDEDSVPPVPFGCRTSGVARSAMEPATGAVMTTETESIIPALRGPL